MALNRALTVIEAPTNLGLKTPESGVTPGVNRLPTWFRQHGLHQRLSESTPVVTVAAPPHTNELDLETGVRQADDVAEYSQKLAQEVKEAVDQQKFALVLGGDCSVLIGCCLGLPGNQAYGLFFVDGHTDFAWPGLSQSGGAAGMDLALVTGHGPSKLTDINGRQPYIAEELAWCIGNRDYDPAYMAVMQSSAIPYWSLERLRREGISTCARAFLEMVNDQHLAGFWIHFDVDVLDDELMPAVDSPQPGGLTYDELNQLLIPLLESGKAVGLDITILDPNRDLTGQYVRQFIDELTPVWDQLAVTGKGDS